MTRRNGLNGGRFAAPQLTVRSASIALVCGGALWGLYWIPVRMFHDAGLRGPWPGIAMYAAALIVLTPALWSQRHGVFKNWRILFYSGLFTGAAFSLFTTSLVYTDVVRSILLFYLTPIWGTLLGLVFLGERVTLGRLMGLAAGLAGLFVVLGGSGQAPWPRNVGDWLALCSGVTWAFGTLGLYQTKDTTVTGQIGAFLVGALLISAITLGINPEGTAVSVARLASWPVLPLAVLSAIYILPMIFLTIWPATMLTPARVGLLLMSEVVVGLISAALFAGEPFGAREAFGALLIVSAALIEVLRGGETADHVR